MSWLVGVILCLACVAAAFGYRRQAVHYRDLLDEMSRKTESPKVVELVRDEPLSTLPRMDVDRKPEQVDSASEILVLKNRIRELETTPERPPAFSGRRPSRDAASTNRVEGASSGQRRGPQAWLESLRENNPQQYEDFVNRREESRQRVETAFTDKALHMLDRESTAMAEDEREEYLRMVNLLNDTWQKTEQLRSDLPWDQRREVMQSVRTNMVVLEPLLLVERDREWVALGKELGYDESGAVELAEYLNRVIDLTSMQDVYREMRSGVFGNMPGRRNSVTSSVPIVR